MATKTAEKTTPAAPVEETTAPKTRGKNRPLEVRLQEQIDQAEQVIQNAEARLTKYRAAKVEAEKKLADYRAASEERKRKAEEKERKFLENKDAILAKRKAQAEKLAAEIARLEAFDTKASA